MRYAINFTVTSEELETDLLEADQNNKMSSYGVVQSVFAMFFYSASEASARYRALTLL